MLCASIVLICAIKYYIVGLSLKPPQAPVAPQHSTDGLKRNHPNMMLFYHHCTVAYDTWWHSAY